MFVKNSNRKFTEEILAKPTSITRTKVRRVCDKEKSSRLPTLTEVLTTRNKISVTNSAIAAPKSSYALIKNIFKNIENKTIKNEIIDSV